MSCLHAKKKEHSDAWARALIPYCPLAIVVMVAGTFFPREVRTTAAAVANFAGTAIQLAPKLIVAGIGVTSLALAVVFLLSWVRKNSGTSLEWVDIWLYGFGLFMCASLIAPHPVIVGFWAVFFLYPAIAVVAFSVFCALVSMLPGGSS